VTAPRAPVLAFGVEPSDRRYRLRLARYPALAATLAEVLAARGAAAPPLRLLDVGVGRGRTLRYLEPTGLAERVRWVGIDLDPRTAQRVHRREAWRLVHGDVSRPLPFRDGAFDAVVCEQVLEHVEDPSALLAEIARCLVPGGTLVLGVPTFPPGIAALRGLLPHRGDVGEHGVHGHVGAWSLPSLRRLVRRSGAFDEALARGFRVASGGFLAPLEDRAWWWRWNAALGRALPVLCAEVQLVLRRLPPGTG
jgi:SAM-dependent methyltransferase